MTSSSKEMPRNVFDSYGATRRSLHSIHVAYKIYKSAVENSRCCRAEDGSSFEIRRTWYRSLMYFSVHKEDGRRLFSCAFERDAARVFDSLAGIHGEAAADQL